MSRTNKGKPRNIYAKESSIFKKIWRRKRRAQGKRLMEDDNPDKGTQGWYTW